MTNLWVCITIATGVWRLVYTNRGWLLVYTNRVNPMVYTPMVYTNFDYWCCTPGAERPARPVLPLLLPNAEMVRAIEAAISGNLQYQPRVSFQSSRDANPNVDVHKTAVFAVLDMASGQRNGRKPGFGIGQRK